MTLTVREKLDAGPLFDSAIVAHQFTSYMRDYDVMVDVPAAVPGGGRSYIEGRYRYRFTHCVVAHVTTRVADESWRVSWDDRFIDYAVWEEAGSPDGYDGYVWGVCFALAYPGLIYIEDSVVAREWTDRLRQLMHQVVIKTYTYTLQLVFHDVHIQKVARGDPLTGDLAPSDAV
jgi:hypothetical protein